MAIDAAGNLFVAAESSQVTLVEQFATVGGFAGTGEGRDVEGPASQVEDHDLLVLLLVQPVGQGGGHETQGAEALLLGQAPLRYAVEQVGWRPPMVGLGVVALGLSLMLFLVVPPRPPRSPDDAGHHAGPLSGLKSVLSNPQSWACAGIGFGMSSAMLAL